MLRIDAPGICARKVAKETFLWRRVLPWVGGQSVREFLRLDLETRGRSFFGVFLRVLRWR